MRPVRRTLAGLLALALATAAALLAAARPAAAHGTLAMSTPAEGAVVTEPLAAVELYFTEKVAPNAYFTVTAPDGGRVDGGWSHGAPKPLPTPVREYFMVDGKFEPREYATGFPAVVSVSHLPAAGRYSVTYLSVASDGEAVRGTMSFRYSGRPTPAPRGWSPPADQPDPALVAAAQRHGDTGHGAATVAPAATPSAVPGTGAPVVAAAGDGGGPGWITWSGWAVAVAAAMAGFVGWRRRPSAQPDRKPGWAVATAGAAAGLLGRRRPPAKPSGKRPRKAAPATRKRQPGDTSPAPQQPPGGSAPAARRPMGNVRLAVVGGGLVVALLGGFGLGRLGTGEQAATPAPPAGAAPGAGDGHQHPAGTGQAQGQVTGTTVSAGGYTLQPGLRTQAAGSTVDYTFRVVGADRAAATRFTVVHDRTMHLVVVGRDLSGYQHLHPTMDPDGTWRVPLRLDRPGAYRLFADFTVTAEGGTELPLVLGVDHEVPGAHTPAALPAAAGQASAGPFTVGMEGTPVVGATSPLLFRVSRGGPPGPSRLERYLGAYGHLVVVREGDLGYVHVHPEAELVDGAVKFWLAVPGAGRYRAFFDFQVGGEVHTAAYTMEVA